MREISTATIDTKTPVLRPTNKNGLTENIELSKRNLIIWKDFACCALHD